MGYTCYFSPHQHKLLKMKVIFLVFAILSTVALALEEKPTEPTKCSAANQGRCPCGDEDKGFTTYTFWQGDEQRCFHVFFPPERKGEVLPVAVYSNCYAKDSLAGTQSLEPEKGRNGIKEINAAAARYGYAKIGISSPRGGWQGGNRTNENALNDDNHRCSDENSVDIAYVRKILQWVEANPDLDATRMWAWGFSQNSAFSTLIAFCFPNNFVGVFAAGFGMRLICEKPYGPGCSGQAGRNPPWKGEEWQLWDQEKPCTDCKYVPNYPCYNPARPMIGCAVEYTNDNIAVDTDWSGVSSSKFMYEALINEGHDGRLLRFSPNGDIKGKHKAPRNLVYWQVSCLGITEPCSEVCEGNFLKCIEEQNPTKASAQAAAFNKCIAPKLFNDMDGCTLDCAPTINMLWASETPTEALAENFGIGHIERPETSKCTV